jgi:DnaK suppressor protein
LNPQQLIEFKELLLARRQELLDEAGRTLNGMTNGPQVFADPTDRATLESDRIPTLRMRDRERKLIAKIDSVLERIGDGSYGLCDECGEPIAVERLRARPETTLCIACKSEQEEEERRQKNL